MCYICINNQAMKIGKIDTDKKVFIIAEIGNNHEGSFKIAKKMMTSKKYWTEINDKRITKLGKILRKYSIDELPHSLPSLSRCRAGLCW